MIIDLYKIPLIELTIYIIMNNLIFLHKVMSLDNISIGVLTLLYYTSKNVITSLCLKYKQI